MQTSLISPDWDFAIWTVLFAIAAFGFWADKTRLGQRISGLGLMLVTAMILGNAGIMPHSAPAYNVVWNFLVPTAIPLLLFKANLKRVVMEIGPMIKAFVIGVLGTVLGVILGLWALPLGPLGADIGGILAATYIGGSMNFAAVAEALEFRESATLTAALAADNVAGMLHILFIVMIPSIALLRRWIPSPMVDNGLAGDKGEAVAESEPVLFNPVHLCVALALSLVIVAIGYTLAEIIGAPSYGVLFITAISLLIASAFHERLEKLQGPFDTGMIMMYVFFATIGAGADVGVMIDVGGTIFLYAGIIILVHVITLIIGAKLLGIDLAAVVIASLACISGPVAPAAISASRGWKELITPGLMAGILGYAIANFIGVGLAELLST